MSWRSRLHAVAASPLNTIIGQKRNIDPRVHKQINDHPYPLLFATISASHLYDFPSPDSDFDLRGVHLLPLEEIVGLQEGRETVEKSGNVESVVGS